MTTEDDFQRMLDANPGDHATRLVFSEWLRDRDDPRADGYQALAANNRFASPTSEDWAWWGKDSSYHRELCAEHRCLPSDWFALLPEGNGMFAPAVTVVGYRAKRTRRQVEDSAALAFLGLPPQRREVLLSGKAVTV